MRTTTTAALAAAALIGATACEPNVVDTPGTAWQATTLTHDANDRYLIAGDSHFTTATAPLLNTAGNTRVVLVHPGGPSTVDQAICTTITGATAPQAQQGVVLRFDGTHAITVTKNIYGGQYTTVNVHQWDLSLPDPGGRFTYAGGWNLPGIGHPGPVAAFPWRMCAGAAGSTVSFKVWPVSRPEPADGDPCCTGSLPLAVWPGRPGVYIGHIPPGHTSAYTDTTWFNIT